MWKNTGFMLYALLAAGALPLAGQAAEKIHWQHAWEAGETLTYATELLDERTQAGATSRTRATDTTEIRIIEARDAGFIQAWTSHAPRIELIEGDPATQAMAQASMEAIDGLALEVALDADANFAGIRNLDVAAARLRPVLRKAIEAGVESGLAKLAPDERAKARDAARQRIEGALAQLTSPAMLQAMLGRTPEAYNGFVGAELEAGEWYVLETELDNPLGGPKFPARLEFGFSVSEGDPDDIFLEWTQTIDPEAGAEAAWSVVEKLGGRAIDPAMRKGLPKELDLRDEGMMLFRRDSGIVEMFESTRTVKLGGEQQVQRQRMRLTGGDHDHVWTDETEQAPAGDAAADATAAQG